VFNIGPAELLVVLVIALLVLGPSKLPDAARQVGRALGEMRKLSSGFQAEMRDALKEPVEGKPTASKSVSASTSGSSSTSVASTTSASLPAATADAATGGSLAAPRLPATDATETSAAVAVGDESGPLVPGDTAADSHAADSRAGDGAETPLPVTEVVMSKVTSVEHPAEAGPEPGPRDTSAG
jgi:sec-independent protein translocase protein TatB